MPKLLPCAGCSTPLTSSGRARKYCSSECWPSNYVCLPPARRQCRTCFKTFSGHRQKKYCSKQCYPQHLPVTLEKRCVVCGSAFSTTNNTNKVCSATCRKERSRTSGRESARRRFVPKPKHQRTWFMKNRDSYIRARMEAIWTTRQCRKCAVSFSTMIPTKVRCNDGCSHKPMERPCARCGIFFERKIRTCSKYCSDVCRRGAVKTRQPPPPDVICVVCGTAYKKHRKWGQANKTCSIPCRDSFRAEQKRNSKRSENMSEQSRQRRRAAERLIRQKHRIAYLTLKQILGEPADVY